MQPERYQPFLVTTALPDFTQGEAYIQVVSVQDLQAVHDRLSPLAPEHLRGARMESAMRWTNGPQAGRIGPILSSEEVETHRTCQSSWPP